MIAHDATTQRRGPGPAAAGHLPEGLPATATIRRVALAADRSFELLLVPTDDAPSVDDQGGLAELAGQWATATVTAAAGLAPAAVTVPLYGCHVIWTASRGAVLGPSERGESLAATLADFAVCEAELRDLEARGNALLATVDDDAPAAFEHDERSLAIRPRLADRFREAVAVRRGLAGLGPAVHVPPVHPPTVASQLAERLRDRTRLAERHDLASDRADFTLQIYEACGQRASDFAIARRQIGLEWAIIVILLVQVAIMLVDMLTSGSGT